MIVGGMLASSLKVSVYTGAELAEPALFWARQSADHGQHLSVRRELGGIGFFPTMVGHPSRARCFCLTVWGRHVSIVPISKLTDSSGGLHCRGPRHRRPATLAWTSSRTAPTHGTLAFASSREVRAALPGFANIFVEALLCFWLGQEVAELRCCADKIICPGPRVRDRPPFSPAVCLLPRAYLCPVCYGGLS